MEELKLLVDMVANLPTLAVWVVVMFLVYKLAVIGSIYGVIRFAIDKLYLFGTKEKHIEVRAMLDGLCIKDAINPLMAQLHRLKPMSYAKPDPTSPYIHTSAVDWLREAIDDKIEKDRKKS